MFFSERIKNNGIIFFLCAFYFMQMNYYGAITMNIVL